MAKRIKVPAKLTASLKKVVARAQKLANKTGKAVSVKFALAQKKTAKRKPVKRAVRRRVNPYQTSAGDIQSTLQNAKASARIHAWETAKPQTVTNIKTGRIVARIVVPVRRPSGHSGLGHPSLRKPGRKWLR